MHSGSGSVCEAVSREDYQAEEGGLSWHSASAKAHRNVVIKPWTDTSKTITSNETSLALSYSPRL